jgi:hypothetical protein
MTMQGLATARALIVDDDEGEAAAMLRALASLGVGAVYLSGDGADEPTEKLRGIRFAALDLFLTPGVNAQVAASQVTGVLSRVIHPDNGPYVAVGWTKSPDDLSYLRAAIRALPAAIRPLKLVGLDKQLFLSGRAWHTQLLAKEIKKVISTPMAFNVAVDWEQLVHEAATETTSSLLPSGSRWERAAKDSLAALLREGAPKTLLEARIPDASRIRRSLYSALQLMHFDYVEQGVVKGATKTRALRDLARHARKLKLDVAHVAELNSSLMLGPTFAGVWPGHVYDLAELKPHISPAKTLTELAESLLLEMFPEPKQGGQKPADFQTKHAAWVEGNRLCMPVALEVSPACDVYQNNLQSARLVLGALAPIGLLDGNKPVLPVEPPTKRWLGPILIKGLYADAPVGLVLSSRFVTGCDPEALASCVPMARLREASVQDVQAWVSSQGARLGQIQVRLK